MADPRQNRDARIDPVSNLELESQAIGLRQDDIDLRAELDHPDTKLPDRLSDAALICKPYVIGRDWAFGVEMKMRGWLDSVTTSAKSKIVYVCIFRI